MPLFPIPRAHPARQCVIHRAHSFRRHVVFPHPSRVSSPPPRRLSSFLSCIQLAALPGCHLIAVASFTTTLFAHSLPSRSLFRAQFDHSFGHTILYTISATPITYVSLSISLYLVFSRMSILSCFNLTMNGLQVS